MAEEKQKKGGAAVAAGLGGFAGGLAGSLLGGSKVVAATTTGEPTDETTELQQILAALQNILTAIQNIPGISVGTGSTGTSSITETEAEWSTTDPVTIFNEAIGSAEPVNGDSIYDARNAKRVLFRAESTLNQDVSIQLVGNIQPNYQGATNLGAPVVCPANDNISILIGMGSNNWQPYIGVVITPVGVPTAGILTILALSQV